MAVATSMLSGSMNGGDDPALARSFYLGAVSRMKERVSEAKGCADDELLMAVMLLQMYEVSRPTPMELQMQLAHISQQLVGRTKKIPSPQAHLDGALALIKHRGVANFKGEVSRGLLYYVRSILVGLFLTDGRRLLTGSGRGMHSLFQSHASWRGNLVRTGT